MKAMVLFSVIIPTYNRSSLLREALDSVFAQTLRDYEVIVVDDGSTDDTEAVVRSYPGRIQFQQQQNLGPGAARNAGVKSAGGEYITFLDSDDLWFPWTLATYKAALGELPQASFVCGDCVKFSHHAALAKIRQTRMELQHFPDYYASWEANIWIGTCGTAISRESFLECGGFHNAGNNAEDSDLWMNLGTAPGFVHLKSPTVFAYRNNPAGVSRADAKTFEGMRKMVLREQARKYPGGIERQRERWEIITWHLRPASLGRLREGDLSGAWWIFWRSLRWQISSRRFRYILAFPILTIFYSLKKRVFYPPDQVKMQSIITKK